MAANTSTTGTTSGITTGIGPPPTDNTAAIQGAWNDSLTQANKNQTDIYQQYGYTGNDVMSTYGNSSTGQQGTGDLNVHWDPTNQQGLLYGALQNYGAQEQNAAKSSMFRGLGNTGLGAQQVQGLHQQQGLATDSIKSALADKLATIGQQVKSGNNQLLSDVAGERQKQSDYTGLANSTLQSQGGNLKDPTAWDTIYQTGIKGMGNDAMSRIKSGTWVSKDAAAQDLGKFRQLIGGLVDNMSADGAGQGLGSLGFQQVHDLIGQYDAAISKSGLNPYDPAFNMGDILKKYNSYHGPVQPTQADQFKAALANQPAATARQKLIQMAGQRRMDAQKAQAAQSATNIANAKRLSVQRHATKGGY